MSDKLKVLASKRRVVEITAVQEIVAAGGYAGGTSACAGFIRGAAKSAGVSLPVTDEVCASRRTHSLTMRGELLNLGRGQQIFDAALSTGRLVSIKGGDSRDITVAVDACRAFIEAGGDVTLYHLQGNAATIREGQTTVEPATDLTMRRISLAAIIEAQGPESWEISDSSEQFAFCRMDGKHPRLRVNFRTVPANLWIDAQAVAFHTNDDLPGTVSYESVNAAPIATASGVSVYDSGKVTVDGVEIAKPMRTGEAALLAAIINANGEAVKAANRQTAKVVKQKLGHASARIETVRGKGYRWVA
tara:strand:- start:407 stop:1315 length:909 start_codon:yes stop_codon:yes gene_type:complete